MKRYALSLGIYSGNVKPIASFWKDLKNKSKSIKQKNKTYVVQLSTKGDIARWNKHWKLLSYPISAKIIANQNGQVIALYDGIPFTPVLVPGNGGVAASFSNDRFSVQTLLKRLFQKPNAKQKKKYGNDLPIEKADLVLP